MTKDVPVSHWVSRLTGRDGGSVIPVSTGTILCPCVRWLGRSPVTRGARWSVRNLAPEGRGGLCFPGGGTRPGRPRTTTRLVRVYGRSPWLQDTLLSTTPRRVDGLRLQPETKGTVTVSQVRWHRLPRRPLNECLVRLLGDDIDDIPTLLIDRVESSRVGHYSVPWKNYLIDGPFEPKGTCHPSEELHLAPKGRVRSWMLSLCPDKRVKTFTVYIFLISWNLEYP